jgi:hypothetical protein
MIKTDAQLQQDVIDELRFDPSVASADIGVSARDGVVTLTGQVDNFAKKSAAVRAHQIRATRIRKQSMVAVSAVVLALFATVAFAAGSISPAAVLLAVAGLLFGYIVVRLSQAMFAADPVRRQQARRGLIVAGAVPVLVLTPAAIGSSPPDAVSMILIAAAIWLALSMSYTSYILASAGRQKADEHAGRRVPRHTPAYLRFVPSARLRLHPVRRHTWAARSR